MMSVAIAIETQPGPMAMQGKLCDLQHFEPSQTWEVTGSDSAPLSEEKPSALIDIESECQELDEALVSSFKQLLQMYSARMNDAGMDSKPHQVSSGGLQQFITRKSLAQSRMTKQTSKLSGADTTTFFDLPVSIII